MANCRNCGHELKPDLRFCSNCGTQVEAVPESFTPVQEPVVAGAAPSLQGGYTPPGQYNPSTGAGSICTATARRTSTAYTGWLHSASTGRIPAPGIRRTRAGSKTAFIR